VRQAQSLFSICSGSYCLILKWAHNDIPASSAHTMYTFSWPQVQKWFDPLESSHIYTYIAIQTNRLGLEMNNNDVCTYGLILLATIAEAFFFVALPP